MIPLEQEGRLMLLRRSRTGDPLRRGLSVYHPLTSVLESLPTGQSVSMVGTGIEADTYRGLDCVKFSSSEDNYFSIVYERPVTKKRIRVAVSVWAMKNESGTWNGLQYLSFGRTYASNTTKLSLLKRNANAENSGMMAALTHGTSAGTTYGFYATTSSDAGWHHFAFNAELGGASQSVCSADIYMDGTLLGSVSQSLQMNDWDRIQFGSHGTASGKVVRLAALRAWDRFLTTAEIAQLAGEFTPATA